MGGIVYLNGYAYVISGYDGSAKTAAVEYAPIDANGTVGAWQSTSSVNTSRYASAAVAAQGHVYLIGGQHDPNWLASVEMATINPDGSLSAWQFTSSLNAPRDNLAAVTAGGYIYALGGTTNSWYDIGSVEYAAIQLDGSLGTWQTTTTMTRARKALMAATDGYYIYAIGGGNGSLTAPSATVERAAINPDGSLGTWTLLPVGLAYARSMGTAMVANNQLVVMGGWSGSVVLDSVEVSAIGAGGVLSPWQSAENLLTARYGMGSVVVSDYVYLLGGSVPPGCTATCPVTLNVDRAELAPTGTYLMYLPNIIR